MERKADETPPFETEEARRREEGRRGHLVRWKEKEEEVKDLAEGRLRDAVSEE